MKWYIECWLKSFDYNGRARRSEFWHFLLYAVAICLISYVIGGVLISLARHVMGKQADSVVVLVSNLISFIYFVHVFPAVAVQTRRLHDIGLSGWYQLITAIPLLCGLLLRLVILVKLQTDGATTISPKWLWLFLLLFAACHLLLLAFNCKAGTADVNRFGKPPKALPRTV